jgi:hypothetical protein
MRAELLKAELCRPGGPTMKRGGGHKEPIGPSSDSQLRAWLDDEGHIMGRSQRPARRNDSLSQWCCPLGRQSTSRCAHSASSSGFSSATIFAFSFAPTIWIM